jgi:hypothetical protein
MSRMNAFLAALLLAALTSFAPSASATTSNARVAIVGSSAAWQSMGLAAYNSGNCAHLSVAIHPPCHHYTDHAKFDLNDTRPTFGTLGGTTNDDKGDLWIVWDTPTGAQVRNVWVFIKVDSIVGDRCFYANPKCNITNNAGDWAVNATSRIPPGLWGADMAPPADVQNLFTSPAHVVVNTAATDIRPEDALFETCRVNSTQGNGSPGSGDGLDGLGYGVNSPGLCPAFGSPLANLVGTPIQSGVTPATGATANPLAFNISGRDPFTNAAIAAPVVLNIGAAPIVFVVSKLGALAGVTAATDAELQNIFSGTDCNASELGGAGPISVFVREPLSGTMTTAEMSVFRRPVKNHPAPPIALGVSQEKGVNHATLALTACPGGGGTRTRGIGTGEVIGKAGAGGVADGGSGGRSDAIAYTFFGFGNVNPIANSASFGYLNLDGADPLGMDLGPNTAANHQLPVCTAPCAESAFWSGNSFPDLRAGNYTAWQLLRMVTTAANKTNITNLLTASWTHIVNETPDYIPLQATGADPGVKIFHSHYQQRNGNNGVLGPAPTNGPPAGFAGGNPPVTAADHGGEAGGCTISTTGITAVLKKNFIQANVTAGPTVTCALDRQ